MPTFKMVSIMPGMDWVAPERTLTNSGRGPRPNVREVLPSSQFSWASTSSQMASIAASGSAWYRKPTSVVMQKAGGHRQLVPAHRVDAVPLVAQNLPRQIGVAVQQHHGLVFGGAFEVPAPRVRRVVVHPLLVRLLVGQRWNARYVSTRAGGHTGLALLLSDPPR